jgi:hypothetical protein
MVYAAGDVEGAARRDALHRGGVSMSPARWDGRPFPGKCGYGDCPNQATTAYGYWDGGAPGAGTWRQRSRCNEHLNDEVEKGTKWSNGCQ